MELEVHTIYDLSALTAMARGLRKTVRRRRSRISRTFGWLVVALGLFLGLITLRLDPPEVGWPSVIVAVLLTAVLLTEDRVNGFFAKNKILSGMEDVLTRFGPEGYASNTQAGESRWHYGNIKAIAEGERYLVLALSGRHAQAFDKQGFVQGDIEQLRALLTEKTGLPICKM